MFMYLFIVVLNLPVLSPQLKKNIILSFAVFYNVTYYNWSCWKTIEMDEEKCTVDELQNVITAPTGGLTMLPSTAYDEVYPNLYLGEE